MIFNSVRFFPFLAVVLVAYYALSKRWRWQNLVLLIASYVGYALWDWRFLGLLIAVTVVNYAAGWAIGRPGERRKRLWLGLAIAFDLCVLGLFKYFNFFGSSLTSLLSQVGLTAGPLTLKLILPLGLSFYIFEAITYPFDIYRGTLAPTKRPLDFALFVAFFPTVVSGPVERASHMLPQFQAPRNVTSDKVSEGLWLVIWGFFQKMVIADNLGLIVDKVYGNYHQYHGLDIVIAILAFTVQILADFGGYTDIARGVARLLGFDLVLNFNVPYFAINPSDFWQRWHISLSSWFRDYVYIPLGGNRKGRIRTRINVFVTMVLCGLWHGAAWTFAVWGAWHGLLQVAYSLLGKGGRSTDRTIRSVDSILNIGSRTCLLVILVACGWAVFRASSFSQVSYLFTHIGLDGSDTTAQSLWRSFCFTAPLVVVQILQLRSSGFAFILDRSPWVRGMAIGLCGVGIAIFSPHQISRFIYQGF